MGDEGFIPVIDLGPARRGDMRSAGNEIHRAFIGSGFCYVQNHGVPAGVIEEAQRQALNFFHLPIGEKLKAQPKESVRGFNAIGRTKMRGAQSPDYKEYYQIGLELRPDDPAVLAGQPLRGPNQWPDSVPEFRPAMTRYFDEVARCGQILLRVLAASLGVAEDFFVDKYEKPLQRTQAVYYPPHPAGYDGELFGVAPHTDYGCVTLLWQDDTGGLEVLDRSGQWVQAKPIPDTLVINIGDLLRRWSNDRYSSTQHRVKNLSGRERLSIATFYDPDFSAVVDPTDLGLRENETPRYEPISAGEYIIGRINASQSHMAAS